MRFGHYSDPSVELAVELVNSEPLLGDPDDLSSVDQLRTFVERHVPSYNGAITARDLAQVHEIRGMLREAFVAETEAEAVELLNGLLARVGARPQLDDHDGRWHLHVVASQPGIAALLAAVAATGVALVVAEHGLERLGVCASQTCIDAFVDTTKNRSRRYCCEGCANVSAVRSHRARASGRSAGDAPSAT